MYIDGKVYINAFFCFIRVYIINGRVSLIFLSAPKHKKNTSFLAESKIQTNAVTWRSKRGSSDPEQMTSHSWYFLFWALCRESGAFFFAFCFLPSVQHIVSVRSLLHLSSVQNVHCLLFWLIHLHQASYCRNKEWPCSIVKKQVHRQGWNVSRRHTGENCLCMFVS